MKTPSLFFVGIGGVGMSSVAGLARTAGFDVRGSDQNLYPPTSLILEKLKIPVYIPYSAETIEKNADCLFVIGNSLSQKHVEVAKILEMGAQYTSFPKLLNEYFLTKTHNIVVCGTHGKTTTSSLLAFTLEKLGANPSYMIGGLSPDLPNSFEWGTGSFFVLEGDEYDTAFFDKGSKFLHYRPHCISFNNLEFDHADIFKDFSSLKHTFHLLLDQIQNPESVVANISDKGVCELLKERGWLDKVSPSPRISRAPTYNSEDKLWHGDFDTSLWGELAVSTPLPGAYNFSNIAQVLGTLTRLVKSGKLEKPNPSSLQKIFRDFRGVARRWDHLASIDGIDLYVDFAHHPTAVQNVLSNLRMVHPKGRIIAAFEPKNASSRRNVFQKQYAEVLKQADRVLIAPAPPDQRIPEQERLDPKALSLSIGDHAQNFSSFDALHEWLRKNLESGDLVVFLSSGDFAGLPRLLVEQLRKKSRQDDIPSNILL